MRSITIIKSATLIQVPVDEQRAVAEYRAFEPLARLHSARVCHPESLELMLGVVEGIRDDLIARRNSLLGEPKSITLSVI